MPSPTLFVIGAAKAGTTALDEYLRQHPALFMSPVREPNHFAFPGGPVPYRGHDGGPAPMARTSVTDPAAYRALFADAPPGAVVGETSPAYLYVPGTAERIAEAVPDARIVVILRDPVERAFSAYQHLLREGREPESFEVALTLEADRIAAGWGILWRYVDAGRYAAQLERYLAVFPRERILVLLHDDLVADAARTCREVFRFAGVDPDVALDTSTRFNVSGAPRSRILQPFVNPPPPVRRALLRLVPGSLEAGVRRLHARASAANLRRLDLAPATRDRLRDVFADDVARVAGLIGRDLAGWLSG